MTELTLDYKWDVLEAGDEPIQCLPRRNCRGTLQKVTKKTKALNDTQNSHIRKKVFKYYYNIYKKYNLYI